MGGGGASAQLVRKSLVSGELEVVSGQSVSAGGRAERKEERRERAKREMSGLAVTFH